MSRGKTEKLSSLFGSALKKALEQTKSKPSPDLKTLTKTLFSEPSISYNSVSEIEQKTHTKAPKFLIKSLQKPEKSIGEDSERPLTTEISSLLSDINQKANTKSPKLSEVSLQKSKKCVGEDLEGHYLTDEISSLLSGIGVSESQALSVCEVNGKLTENVLDISRFSNKSPNSVSLNKKELLRERKKKWIFKTSQSHRFQQLVKMCAQKLGTEATLEVFGSLGRETGVKEYNALVELCIENAKKCNNDQDSLDHVNKALRLFMSMKEQGFPLEEESYRPLLLYLVDEGLVREFHLFSEMIKMENPCRLGYYEMLLWIKVNNTEKVQGMCTSVGTGSIEHDLKLAESYLLALCDCNMKKEILQLLSIVDITKIVSKDRIVSVFRSLGRLSLESVAENLILSFKDLGDGAEIMSSFILSYVTSIPNYTVGEVVIKFRTLHKKLEVSPSSSSYDELIMHCCKSLEVDVALDIVGEMAALGMDIFIETFHKILHACDQKSELDSVHPIYSALSLHNVKPTEETFRLLIDLSVKMKDFEGAYNMLKDLEEMNISPTASIFNTIMFGYFRQKNILGGLNVIKQMKHADVKPNSQTFCYLLNNCTCEEDIIQYVEDLQESGVQVTKQFFMALINAYANCGQFDKAKQVILDPRITIKNLNDIKSTLISALASNGKIADALMVYDEMKQEGNRVEPKAIINVMENIRTEGETDRLLQLLGELEDSNSWFDGCTRIISYCVQFNDMSAIVPLLKLLKEKDLIVSSFFDQFFSQISEAVPANLEMGFEILRNINEELGIRPSRTSLDFLLSACASAKDQSRARLIWEEYQNAGLPYNVLTFLRMYQALLASGSTVLAKELAKKIARDDPHVRCIITACDNTYAPKKKVKSKKVRKTDAWLRCLIDDVQ